MYLNEYWEEQEAIATTIALAAHDGQTYGDDEYYYAHVLPVSLRVLKDPMARPEHYIAAILHDVLEDSDYTVAKLAAAGIDRRVIRMVEDLTKPEGADYMHYVANLLNAESGAALVKYHDMAQNYSCGFREKYVEPLTMYVGFVK